MLLFSMILHYNNQIQIIYHQYYSIITFHLNKRLYIMLYYIFKLNYYMQANINSLLLFILPNPIEESYNLLCILNVSHFLIDKPKHPYSLIAHTYFIHKYSLNILVISKKQEHHTLGIPMLMI